MNSIRLGTDFDNTIVSYEHVFPRATKALGIDVPDEIEGKPELRRFLRGLPDGEILWQKVQAEVYGRRMCEAEMETGFREAMQRCRAEGVPVVVVSHKTRFAAQDPDTDLHKASLQWMESNHFFNPDGLGFGRQDVYFEPTRKEKVRRIGSLGCTHFVDDLPEVFLNSDFPEGVARILYGQGMERNADIDPASDWSEIASILFGCRV